MQILTYPIGLLIGLFPVVVDLGDRPEPARLLLDGRPACRVTADAPSCLLDLGRDPESTFSSSSERTRRAARLRQPAAGSTAPASMPKSALPERATRRAANAS